LNVNHKKNDIFASDNNDTIFGNFNSKSHAKNPV
jgi:hypothetical protein